VEILTDQLH